nr:MAG TPA: Lower baseplate protein N-terminal domain [Caudoviricetes sp.]
MKYYSATNNAFYDDSIIAAEQMPEDAVIVPDEEFAELMAKQQEGYVIVADTDGTPTYMQQSCGQCTNIAHDLVKASSSTLGHVKVDGTNVAVNESGEITLPVLDGYVDKTSDQTISGNKTFDTTNSELIFSNQNAVRTDHYGFIKRTQDYLKLGIQENAPNGTMLQAISISQNGVYASKGDATDNQGSEEIATKGFVNSPTMSLNVVHRTGDETLAGVKTFSATPLVPTPADDAEGQEAVNAAWVKANTTSGDFADTSLSNLSETGQAKFDEKLDHKYFGDGIIDIPRYFKVSYGGSGTPLISANSKIPVPNGIDSDGNIIYDLQTISSSLTVSDSDIASIYEMYKTVDIVWLWKPGEANLSWIPRQASCAGDTAPSTTATRPGWFDTSTGLMKVFNSTTNEWESGYSVPLFQTHGFKGSSSIVLKPSYYCYGFFMLGQSIVALPGIRYRTAYSESGSEMAYRSKFKEYQTETLVYSKNSTGTSSYNSELFFLVLSTGEQKLTGDSKYYGSKTSTPNFWGGALPCFYDARNDVWIDGNGLEDRKAIIGCLKVKYFSDGTYEQVLNVRIPSLEHPDKFRYIVEEGGNNNNRSESTKYRLWNDGWLETWGVQTTATCSAGLLFPLRYNEAPAAFVSTQSTGTFATATTSKNNISITVFKLTAGSAPTSGSAKFSWYACGLAYGYLKT